MKFKLSSDFKILIKSVKPWLKYQGKGGEEKRQKLWTEMGRV